MFSLALVACNSDVDKAKKLVDKIYTATLMEDWDKVEELEAELNSLDLDEDEQAEVLEYTFKKGASLF
jgi:hypothetical protein